MNTTTSAYPTEKFKDKAIIIESSAMCPTDKYYLTSKYQPYIQSIILSRGNLKDRIERLAYEMIQKYKGKKIVFLVILKGAIFFADSLNEKLCELLKVNYNKDQMDFMFEYVSISSYSGTQSTGNVKVNSDVSVFESLKGKDVVIIEDVYDSGKSCEELVKYIKNFEPNSLELAFLFVKMNMNNLKYNVEIDFVGFLIPDVFIIGVGLDYNERFRELNHLCVINQLGIDTFKKN